MTFCVKFLSALLLILDHVVSNSARILFCLFVVVCGGFVLVLEIELRASFMQSPLLSSGFQ
jgi:Flp pilus assembly protein protease CpaA